MNDFVLTQLIRQFPNLKSNGPTKKLIEHEYLKSDTREGVYNDIIDVFTDAYFDSPINEQMNLMTSVGAEIYYYINDFNSADIFGNNILNRTSAAHGTDMLYLFGPTMYKNFFNTDFQSFR